MKGFSLIGKSEQITTTGANLIPFPYVDKDMTKNGVTFEVQPDGGVRIYGKAVETVDFFLSMLDYGNDSIFNNSTGNGKILSGGKDGVGIEYHGTNKRLYLTIVKGKTVNTVIYPQLQNGSTATAYEPYTGEKPSPSPDYPQEIKNVGKYNELTGKYEVDVNITGKNLANTSVFEQGYLKSIDIGQKVSLNTEVLKSFTSNMNVEAIQGASISISVRTKDKSGKKYVFTDENDTIISGKWDTGMNNYSIFSNIQVPQNACKLYFSVVYEVENNTELQIEVGSKVTDFEPYRELQHITLTSERPITKWDKLVEQDGQIGWLYGSKKATFENAVVKNALDANGVRQFNIAFEDIKDSYNMSVALCNMFYPATGYEVYTQSEKNDYYMALWNERATFTSKKLDGIFQTKESFQEWIRQSGLYVWHKTDVTDFVPLPQEEQDAIHALMTYYPTTVITADGGELDPDVEVTYIADTKNYIDQKIDSVVKTVVETQKALL